jgi:hypothetical protein
MHGASVTLSAANQERGLQALATFPAVPPPQTSGSPEALSCA